MFELKNILYSQGNTHIHFGGTEQTTITQIIMLELQINITKPKAITRKTHTHTIVFMCIMYNYMNVVQLCQDKYIYNIEDLNQKNT